MRFSHFDAVQECARAENALHSLREIVAKNDWRNSASTLDILAMALMNLIEGVPSLDGPMRRKLSNAVSKVNELAEFMEVHGSGSVKVSTAKQMATIREFRAVLTRVRLFIQQEQKV